MSIYIVFTIYISPYRQKSLLLDYKFNSIISSIGCLKPTSDSIGVKVSLACKETINHNSRAHL